MTSGPDMSDAAALAAADPGQMLPAIASSAAQVRQAVDLCDEAGVASLADERPRAIVLCGTGVSGRAADLLAALCSAGSPVPVVVHRTPGLPVWVGAADLVVASSSHGRTAQTLGSLSEAARRGCRLLVVGASGSPLHDLAQRGRGIFVPAPQTMSGGIPRRSRASLWALLTPLVVAAEALGALRSVDLDEVATLLEKVASVNRLDADAMVSPAKSLAENLSGTLPLVWGSSALAGAGALRFADQLAVNAKVPALAGTVPDVGAGVLDGPWASRRSVEDLFADREDEVQRPSLRLVLLREPGESEAAAAAARTCADLADDRGVAVDILLAEGDTPLARLAWLVGTTDWASVYLALRDGTNPNVDPAQTALKGRLS